MNAEEPLENYQAGWIKLFRSISNKGWYNESSYVHLWVHLLMKANHKPKEWLYKGKVIKVDAGQFITSRKTLSIETGISQSKVERILNCFKSEQQIEQQNMYTSRLISICNWNDYQHSEQQVDSKRTASGQQVATNNKEKNDNNKDLINNSEIEFSNSDITRLVIESHLTDQDKIARMENLKEELTSSQVWFESVMRATNLSEQQTAEKIKEFIVHISATGEYCHPLSDIKKHSVNWIKKQINEKSNSKKRPTNNEALKKFANRQFTDS